MKKKTSARAKTTRVASKAKAKKKPKTTKAIARKAASRKKPRKAAPVRAGAKPKARPVTPTSSVVAWPGLPPGYFERAR